MTPLHIAMIGVPAHGHMNPHLPVLAELVARGHRVTLLDKNPWLGGKAAQLFLDAPDGSGKFRFDMGPTILTVPRVLHRIFAEAGRERQRALIEKGIETPFFRDHIKVFEKTIAEMEVQLGKKPMAGVRPVYLG